eukprot:RCo044931
MTKRLFLPCASGGGWSSSRATARPPSGSGPTSAGLPSPSFSSPSLVSSSPSPSTSSRPPPSSSGCAPSASASSSSSSSSISSPSGTSSSSDPCPEARERSSLQTLSRSHPWCGSSSRASSTAFISPRRTKKAAEPSSTKSSSGLMVCSKTCGTARTPEGAFCFNLGQPSARVTESRPWTLPSDMATFARSSRAASMATSGRWLTVSSCTRRRLERFPLGGCGGGDEWADTTGSGELSGSPSSGWSEESWEVGALGETGGRLEHFTRKARASPTFATYSFRNPLLKKANIAATATQPAVSSTSVVLQ